MEPLNQPYHDKQETKIEVKVDKEAMRLEAYELPLAAINNSYCMPDTLEAKNTYAEPSFDKKRSSQQESLKKQNKQNQDLYESQEEIERVATPTKFATLEH